MKEVRCCATRTDYSKNRLDKKLVSNLLYLIRQSGRLVSVPRHHGARSLAATIIIIRIVVVVAATPFSTLHDCCAMVPSSKRNEP